MNVWILFADLERRGFTFRVRGNELSIAPATELTDDDDAQISRYLGELIDLVQRYTAGEHGAAFMVSCARAQLQFFAIDGQALCACGAIAPADGCHLCEACRGALNPCVWETHPGRETVARPESRPAA